VRIIGRNLARELTALKKERGKDIALFGSSGLCVSLLEKGLIDELRIMVNPVLVGDGIPLFDGLKRKQSFTLLRTKKFASGNVLLTCRP
jgi:dihydrofolate reductase